MVVRGAAREMARHRTRAAGVALAAALALAALGALTWCHDEARPAATARARDAEPDVALRPPADEPAASPTPDVAAARPDAGTAAPADAVPGLALTGWEIADGTVRRGDAWRIYQSSFRPLKRDDLDGAARLLRDAISTEATFEQAYAALGVVRMREKAYGECAEVSRRCVALAFDGEVLGSCFYNLGVCLERQRDDAAALVAFERSLESRDNAVVAKARARVARRLGRGARFEPARAAREALVRSASEWFLRRQPPCEGPVASDGERPGVFACGGLEAWGAAGSFAARDAEEVLLALGGDPAADSGVLLRRDAGEWREVARVPRLAPREGGVDFEGELVGPDGRSRPVVEVSECHDGCCRGGVLALSFEPRDGAIETSAEELFPVVAERGAAEARHALITGARPIEEARDGGVAAGLLLRHETRAGRANPYVRYLTVELDGARARVRGDVPAGAAARCE
jgi:tetratricopeptide (TPR) repeat protein